MSERLLAVTCVTMVLLIGGCSRPTCTETKTPPATVAPKAPEAPKAVEAPKAPVAPKVTEAPKPAQAPAVPEPVARMAIRVNCGATESYTDKAGNTWAADQLWETGRTWGADGGLTVDRGSLGITGTDAPRVYELERYSMSSYKFTVPNGKYTVRLHFAETFEGIMGPGERVFSVSVPGQEVLKDLDLFKTVGFLKPLVKEYRSVSVENGQLMIGFTPNIENPQICGIEIVAE